MRRKNWSTGAEKQWLQIEQTQKKKQQQLFLRQVSSVSLVQIMVKTWISHQDTMALFLPVGE